MFAAEIKILTFAIAPLRRTVKAPLVAIAPLTWGRARLRILGLRPAAAPGYANAIEIFRIQFHEMASYTNALYLKAPSPVVCGGERALTRS